MFLITETDEIGGLGVCLDIATVTLRACSAAGLDLSGLCVAGFGFGGAGGVCCRLWVGLL